VASKHADIGLTKVIALEYGDKNIQAVAVCPGLVKTQMYDLAMLYTDGCTRRTAAGGSRYISNVANCHYGIARRSL
jgi:NAD(P)-dependent dehydrogenase (short-subunit alcohol dehydrogenase family)